MLRYNIDLCDDESAARNTVASLTERWALPRGHDITGTEWAGDLTTFSGSLRI